MSEDACFCVRVKGSERLLRCNDLIVGDVTEPGATTHSGCTAVTLRVPESTFKRYLPAADDLNGLVVRGNRGAGLIVATMIRALAPNKVSHVDATVGEHIATALLHTIAAAYAETYDVKAGSGTSADYRRQEIRQFVDSHLEDTELSVGRVAAAFSVSERYVRMLFAEDSEPLSAYILRRRLEECAGRLRDPLWRCRSVSEIAFAWGFNSLGSFDRAFKARFDMTPRRYRVRTAERSETA